MATLRTYSVNEASYLTGIAAKELTREYDEGVFKQAGGKRVTVSKRSLRMISAKDARYLGLMTLWPKEFSKEGRLTIYKSIRRLKLCEQRLAIGNATYDLAPIDKQLLERGERLKSLKTRIVARDGDAFFAGRETSAYRVAALAKSQSIDEILHDYPSLSRSQVQDAIDYDKAYPKQGRPYPSRSMKRTLMDLAEAGAFDHLSSGDGADAS